MADCFANPPYGRTVVRSYGRQIKTGGTASSNPITFIWRNPYPVPIYADSIAASAGKLTECIVQLDLLPTQQRRQLGSILVQQQS